jgi:hypothetical protein
VNTIAAVTTATGLTVAAMLDTGTYPVKVKISDKKMKDLHERVLARHGFHGSWNYTIRPAAALQDPPPAAPPGPDLDALACPALTGMSRQDFAALVTALDIPARASREQRLYTARGGPRRKASGPAGPRKLSLAGHILAVLLRRRLGMPCHLAAALLAVTPDDIANATRRTAPLLRDHAITITPAATPVRTHAALAGYAADAGITLPPAPAPITPSRRDTPHP